MKNHEDEKKPIRDDLQKKLEKKTNVLLKQIKTEEKKGEKDVSKAKQKMKKEIEEIKTKNWHLL